MQFKKVGVASDHAGKELKSMVLDFLALNDQLEKFDYGVDAHDGKSVDYPDFAVLLARDVAAGKLDGGIAICGTGLGMSITANKIPGIRATVVWDEYSTRMARAHNDSNVLCLGGRTLNDHRAIDLVKIWLETPFAEGRHKLRIDKIHKIDKEKVKSTLG